MRWQWPSAAWHMVRPLQLPGGTKWQPKHAQRLAWRGSSLVSLARRASLAGMSPFRLNQVTPARSSPPSPRYTWGEGLGGINQSRGQAGVGVRARGLLATRLQRQARFAAAPARLTLRSRQLGNPSGSRRCRRAAAAPSSRLPASPQCSEPTQPRLALVTSATHVASSPSPSAPRTTTTEPRRTSRRAYSTAGSCLMTVFRSCRMSACIDEGAGQGRFKWVPSKSGGAKAAREE